MNDNHYNLYNRILIHYHNGNVHDFSFRFIAMSMTNEADSVMYS